MFNWLPVENILINFLSKKYENENKDQVEFSSTDDEIVKSRDKPVTYGNSKFIVSNVSTIFNK